MTPPAIRNIQNAKKTKQTNTNATKNLQTKTANKRSKCENKDTSQAIKKRQKYIQAAVLSINVELSIVILVPNVPYIQPPSTATHEYISTFFKFISEKMA